LKFPHTILVLQPASPLQRHFFRMPHSTADSSISRHPRIERSFKALSLLLVSRGAHFSLPLFLSTSPSIVFKHSQVSARNRDTFCLGVKKDKFLGLGIYPKKVGFRTEWILHITGTGRHPATAQDQGLDWWIPTSRTSCVFIWAQRDTGIQGYTGVLHSYTHTLIHSYTHTGNTPTRRHADTQTRRHAGKGIANRWQ
jgi:hypothetical protein